MPPILIGVAVAVAGSAVGGAIGALAVSIGLSMISSGIAQAIAGSPSAPSFDSSLNVTSTQPDGARQVIYGRTKVGGNRVYISSTGNNQFMHMVIAFAAHEIDSFETIYFDDNAITLDVDGNEASKYSGFAKVKKHLGAFDQAADADMVADLDDWTEDHRLRGIAYLYVRLKWNSDLFNEIPNISAVIKGRKLYDPRDEDQDIADPASWVWSDNAALCIADFYRGVPIRDGAGDLRRLYGLNAPDDFIDFDEIAAEANICDEAVTLAEGGTQARYTINGVLGTDAQPEETLASLLSACMGMRLDAGGLLSLRVAAARSPSLVLSEADLVNKGSWQPQRPIEETYNSVKGKYRGADTSYDIGDVPPYQDSALLAHDGRESWLELTMPFTDTAAAAQRLQTIALSENRREASASLPFNLTALQLRAGDWFSYTSPRRGYDEKTFRVRRVGLAHESDSDGVALLSVTLDIEEIDSGAYAWSSDDQVIVLPAPTTNLPNPLVVPKPTGLSAELLEFLTIGKVRLACTPASDGPNVRYLFEYRVAGAVSWIALPASETPEAYLDLGIGDYQFRVRASVVPYGGASAYEPDAAGLDFALTAPLVVPRVTNVAVVGGVNQNEFLGPDVTITWREGSVNASSWSNGLNNEAGADINARDEWLEGFAVEIRASTGEFLRSVLVNDTHYTYPLSLNKADAARVLGAMAPLRALSFSIQQRARYGQDVVLSTAQVINVANPAPAVLSGITITGFSRSAWVDFNLDDDGDLAGTIIRGSTVSGFDAAAGGGAVLYQGNQFSQVPIELEPGVPIYIQIASYDLFGQTGLNWSSEIRVAAVGIGANEIAVDSVSALTANLGDIVAGRVRRKDSTWVIDLDGKYEIMKQ